MQTVITIDDLEIQTLLKKLSEKAGNMQPVMREIAAILHGATEDAFESESSLDGTAWAPIKRKGKILQDTGGLAASISQHYGEDFALVGSNKVYARIHQLGGKTAAHTIKPRHKKSLAFGGRVVKKVSHPGSNIPARPFLGISPLARKKIINALKRHLSADAE